MGKIFDKMIGSLRYIFSILSYETIYCKFGASVYEILQKMCAADRNSYHQETLGSYKVYWASHLFEKKSRQERVLWGKAA